MKLIYDEFGPALTNTFIVIDKSTNYAVVIDVPPNSLDFINKTTPISFKGLINQIRIRNLLLSEDLYWMTNIYSQCEITANELNNFVRVLLKKGVYVL